MPRIPVVDARELEQADAALLAELRAAFGEQGVLHLAGHGIGEDELGALYEAFLRVARLPGERKRALERGDLWYQRGLTPPNTEAAVVEGGEPDFKECYFACTTPFTDEDARRFPELYAANVWPEEVPELEEAYRRVAARLQELGERVLRACERALELSAGALVDAVQRGPHVTRLLHYLPVPSDLSDAECAGAATTRTSTR